MKQRERNAVQISKDRGVTLPLDSSCVSASVMFSTQCSEIQQEQAF